MISVRNGKQNHAESHGRNNAVERSEAPEVVEEEFENGDEYEQKSADAHETKFLGDTYNEQKNRVENPENRE